MSNVVTKDAFLEIFSAKLGEKFDQALAVFLEYGRILSYDVTNVLLHASDKGKVDEVLWVLENHYETHLQFHHPDIRGTVVDEFGINATQSMFTTICTEVLGLQPS